MSWQKFWYWIQDSIKTELIVYKYDYAMKNTDTANGNAEPQTSLIYIFPD